MPSDHEPRTESTAASLETEHRLDSRRVLPLALPVVAENILVMAVGWSDMVLAGRVFEEAKYLAAMTVAAYLLWFLRGCTELVATGAEAVVARLVGARQFNEASHYVQQALILAFALGAMLGTGVVLGSDLIAVGMNLPEDARPLAAQYLRVVAAVSPFEVMMIVGVGCMRVAGRTSAGMLVGGAVNVLNVLLCWTLSRGIAGVGGIGWTGLGFGTASALAFGALASTFLLWRGVGPLRLPHELPKPDSAAMRRMLRIGVPGAAAKVGLIVCHLWFVAVIGRLGEVATAAHGVAVQVESLSYLLGEAFAVAGGAMLGQALGAGRQDLARAAGIAAVRWAALAMGAMGVLFFFIPRALCGLFSDRAEVVQQSVSVLQLIAISEPALACAIVFGGLLRTAGDTRWLLVLNLAGLLGIRIPLAYLLIRPEWGLGLQGAWIAMLIDVAVRAFLAGLRFFHGGWTRVTV